MLWQKSSIRAIAGELGRNPSSVSREIRRNKPPERNRYTPRLAHGRAIAYRKHRGKRKLEQDGQLRDHVVAHLKLGWSPEQIAATTKDGAAVYV
jgi:IS30 family transposase